MRYAIFSDIHGNWEALTAVISSLKREEIDQVFCGGDIVGYGANPKECIDYIRQNQIPCIAGNHDWAVADKMTTERFNPYAKEAVVWTQKILSPDEKIFLEGLPLTLETEDFILTHGSLNEPDQFNYIFDNVDASSSFECLKKNMCFIGHTHAPRIFIQSGKSINEETNRKILLQSGLKYLVNVGSVGQSRDGNPQASFCLYDTQRQELQIKRIPYQIKEAQRKILEAGLPRLLATRLEFGS